MDQESESKSSYVGKNISEIIRGIHILYILGILMYNYGCYTMKHSNMYSFTLIIYGELC